MRSKFNQVKGYLPPARRRRHACAASTFYLSSDIAMDPELSQCIASVPACVRQLESSTDTTDINLAESLTRRAEEFVELLRVLSGEALIKLAQ